MVLFVRVFRNVCRYQRHFFRHPFPFAFYAWSIKGTFPSWVISGWENCNFLVVVIPFYFSERNIGESLEKCLQVRGIVFNFEVSCYFVWDLLPVCSWNWCHLAPFPLDFVIFVLIAILRLFEDKLDEWLPNIKILWSVVETVTLFRS